MKEFVSHSKGVRKFLVKVVMRGKWRWGSRSLAPIQADVEKLMTKAGLQV